MVEGHQCHRVAAAHRKLLLNHAFQATSPNGRFKDGAAAVNQRPLRRIEVHGKNLFYLFCHNSSVATMPLLPGAPASPATTAPVAATAVAAAASTPQAPQKGRRPSRQRQPPAPRPAGRHVDATAALEHSDRANMRDEHDPLRIDGDMTAIRSATALAAAAAAMSTAVAAAAVDDDAADTDALASGGAAAADTVAEAVGREAGSGPAGAGVEAGRRQQAGVREEAGGGEEEGERERVVVVRVHFGMSGAFRVSTLPAPEPTPTTRLALTNSQLGVVCYLSAMTVEHGGLELYRTTAAKLGPDPLRQDADKEVLWQSLCRSRKPVGLALMSQDMVAGIGNIYRAEILFKAGVHPEQLSKTLTRDQYERLWAHSVELLKRGFESGVIRTVDPQEALQLGKPWTRRYVYNQKQCGRCKGPVRRFDMSARKVFCCETCQPLPVATAAAAAVTVATDGGTATAMAASITVQASGARASSAAAGPGKRSSAAKARKRAGAGMDSSEGGAGTMESVPPPRKRARRVAQQGPQQTPPARSSAQVVLATAADQAERGHFGDLQPDKMTVAQLREVLSSLSSSTRGNKAQLAARLAGLQPALRATQLAATTPPATPPAVHQLLPLPQQGSPALAEQQPQPQPQRQRQQRQRKRLLSQAQLTGDEEEPASSEDKDSYGASGSEDELDKAEALLAAGLGVPNA